VLSAGAFARGTDVADTAYVPFVVNVAATVKAEFKDGATVITQTPPMSVTANTEAFLRVPLKSSVGVLLGTQRQANVPAIISSRRGKVTLNLPVQSYKNAEISLYTVNGKRVLRNKVSASSAANSILRSNIAAGAYLLTIRGLNGLAFTSRLTHGGGNLVFNVFFGSETHSSAPRMTKMAADGGWTITVSAPGYIDSTYTLNLVAGVNPRQEIALRTVPATGFFSPQQPVAASKYGEPVVLKSWAEGGRNWYIIDVGYVENSLVMETEHEHYEGLVEITYTKEVTVKTSISESRAASVSNSIVVSKSLTEKVGIEAAIKSALKAQAFGVEAGVESSLKSKYQISQTVSVSQGRTATTSETFTESFERQEKETSTVRFDRNTPAGYYRYAWYATWDVYFIISTSSDNKDLKNWDVVSCPRAVGTKGLEYSPNNKFDNSPREGDEIVFENEFWKKLPKPVDTVVDTVVENKEFTTVGDYTYTFSKGFPAIVEIYVLGAGGGGQGGHTKDRGMQPSGPDGDYSGTGGAGGGGAATYMKFKITEHVTFNITVGGGGAGGSGIYRNYTSSWQSGTQGGRGGNTSVIWGSSILTAEGGYGGGGDGTITTGGSGGRANTTWPVTYMDASAVVGSQGSNGNAIDDKYGDITSTGGTAALMSKGSIVSFGGGLGALRHTGSSNPEPAGSGGGGSGGYGRDQSGSTGGNGQVKIVVSYTETTGL
jgi:hypothetical protein